MDHRALYLQKHQVPELIDGLITKLVDAMPGNATQFLVNELSVLADQRYASDDNFPAFPDEDVIVGQVLTHVVYAKLKDAKTLFGCSLDEALQDGIDNQPTQGVPCAPPTVGLVACDEDSFVTLAEVYNAVLKVRHGMSYLAKNAPIYNQESTAAKLKGGFSCDDKYVNWVVCRVKRNFAGMRFAPTMSRAERRDAEKAMVNSCLSFLTGSNAGRYYSVADMPADFHSNPRNYPLLLPGRNTVAAATPSAARDWPDARGAFLTNDESVAVHVNCGQEHVEVVCAASLQHNIRDAFERAVEIASTLEGSVRLANREFATHLRLGYLTSDLNFVGAGVSIEACMNIPKVAQQANVEQIMKKLKLGFRRPLVPDDAAGQEAMPPGSLLVGTTESLACSPLDIAQQAINGIGKLCDIQAKLEKGAAGDDEGDEEEDPAL